MGKTLGLVLVLLTVTLCFFGVGWVNEASANFIPLPVPTGIRIENSGIVNGTNLIQRDGDVYTLVADINQSIIILRDNITLDGAGFTVVGSGNSTGVFLQGRFNVTVKNLTIRNFDYGVTLTWASVVVVGSRQSSIIGNNITGNTVGILLDEFTRNNSALENSVTNNTYGIKFIHAQDSTLKNNQLANNQYNLWIDISTVIPAREYYSDIDSSNTVDGKPVYYWVDQHNRTVPSDAGYVGLVNCTGITVENLNLRNNGQGVLMISTNNSRITGNHIAEAYYGIALYGPYVPCTNNTVTYNTIVGSTEEAILELDGIGESAHDPSNSIHDNTVTVPEFPSWSVLPLFALMTGVAVLVYFKKRKH